MEINHVVRHLPGPDRKGRNRCRMRDIVLVCLRVWHGMPLPRWVQRRGPGRSPRPLALLVPLPRCVRRHACRRAIASRPAPCRDRAWSLPRNTCGTSASLPTAASRGTIQRERPAPRATALPRGAGQRPVPWKTRILLRRRPAAFVDSSGTESISPRPMEWGSCVIDDWVFRSHVGSGDRWVGTVAVSDDAPRGGLHVVRWRPAKRWDSSPVGFTRSGNCSQSTGRREAGQEIRQPWSRGIASRGVAGEDLPVGHSVCKRSASPLCHGAITAGSAGGGRKDGG